MTNNTQQGSTLIEVLVAVLVISIGLLSMATLQLQSIKLNQAALEKMRAVNLANEIADTLFINSEQANNGDYTLDINQQTNNAPANTVASENLTNWLDIVRGLPGGRFGISPPAGMAAASNIRTFTITIQWRDAFGANVNSVNNFTFRASSRL